MLNYYSEFLNKYVTCDKNIFLSVVKFREKTGGEQTNNKKEYHSLKLLTDRNLRYHFIQWLYLITGDGILARSIFEQMRLSDEILPAYKKFIMSNYPQQDQYIILPMDDSYKDDSYKDDSDKNDINDNRILISIFSNEELLPWMEKIFSELLNREIKLKSISNIRAKYESNGYRLKKITDYGIMGFNILQFEK